MNFKLSPADALKKLQDEHGLPSTIMMKQGSMTIEYFAPKEVDTQKPHMQDEIYVIVKGHATFNRNGERASCNKEDILFVPAGMEHRFENFSNDFATWVIFYGPDGGEKA